MESEKRPDPLDILEYASKQETERSRGKLKIFLGYSAGVGKTYKMLEDALKKQSEGVNVEIGIIETHNRKETDELAVKIHQIPRKTYNHKGIMVFDLDIDRCLELKPNLLLVDELAHTNPDGARNEKRYNDIEELLQAGINVYTTLNIQHLDSMNDLIFEFTGIRVHETIPDVFFEQSYEIELIDLPPDELLQRLKDGKVYIPDQIKTAMNNFFTDKNLISLREITLRKAASHIDKKIDGKIKAKDIELSRSPHENILTILGQSQELNEKTIRISKRISDQTKSDWYVIYIETKITHWRSYSTPKQILTSITLAESLGAKTSIVRGEDFISLLMDFAKKNSISRFVVGTIPKRRWRKVLTADTLDEIIRASGWIDVHVVTDSSIKEKQNKGFRRSGTMFQYYFLSIIISFISTAINWFLKGFLDPINLLMIYLISVVIVSILFGLGPSIVTAIINFSFFDFFFILPYFTLEIENGQYIITLTAFLIVAFVISYLISREKNIILLYKEQGIEISQIYNLSRELVGVVDLRIATKILVDYLKDVMNLDVSVLVSMNERLEEIKSTFTQDLDENSNAIAKFTYLSGKPSGLKTTNISGSKMQFIPLTTAKKIVGVIVICPIDLESFLPYDKNETLKSVVDLAAITLERVLTEKNPIFK